MKNHFKLPKYPIAPSVPVIEDYFGVKIQDDFRNLEHPDDEAVQKWLKEEALYAKNILGRITGQAELLEKIQQDSQQKNAIVKNICITNKEEYFFLKQEPNENTAQLFYRQSLDSEDELLYSPKHFKPKLSNPYLINYINPSWNGAYLVLGLTHSGIEITEMIVIDMATRKVLPYIIDHAWPSEGEGISWLPDNSGFMYWHHPVIDHKSPLFLKDTSTVLYTIGDDPKELNIIFSKATQPELAMQSGDFPMAFIPNQSSPYVQGSIEGAEAYCAAYYTKIENLQHKHIHWKPLYSKEDKIKKGVFDGNQFIYLSAKNSSNFQIMCADMHQLDKPSVLVDYKVDEVIKDFQITADGLYFSTTKNGVEGKLYVLKNGEEQAIPLPTAAGNVTISSKGLRYNNLWVTTIGWTSPLNRYQYQQQQFIAENLAPITTTFNFNDFVVKELLVTSHDGAEVPLSIIHQKGIALNGQHPTLFLGYGSYGISIPPVFKPHILTWVKEGGIYCIAHVRGGGEKGDEWYQGGRKSTKPNTWKDLIACTEYMIAAGYTSSKKTIIQSGSAGGILIGRAMTERPDLFAVAIARVGSMNPLRAETKASGLNNVKEFGTCTIAEECRALIEMDAYLHLEKGTKYPATLLTAGMNDPRTPVWQPAKFAAKLQLLNGSDKPILFDINYEGGHGVSSTLATYYGALAKLYAFALWQTGDWRYRVEL